MPKQKTHKSLSKRVKVTARGRLKRSCGGRGHLFMNKSSKQKRRLRGGALISETVEKKLRDMLQF